MTHLSEEGYFSMCLMCYVCIGQDHTSPQRCKEIGDADKLLSRCPLIDSNVCVKVGSIQ